MTWGEQWGGSLSAEGPWSQGLLAGIWRFSEMTGPTAGLQYLLTVTFYRGLRLMHMWMFWDTPLDAAPCLESRHHRRSSRWVPSLGRGSLRPTAARCRGCAPGCPLPWSVRMVSGRTTPCSMNRTPGSRQGAGGRRPRPGAWVLGALQDLGPLTLSRFFPGLGKGGG